MKKLIFAALLACNGALLAQYTPPATPVGIWEFNYNFNDASGSGYSGASTSPPTFIADRCGVPGSAVHFNSSLLQFISFPNVTATSLLGNSARSVSFWMRSTNTTTSNPRAIFGYGKTNGQSGQVGSGFEINHNYCANGVGLDVSDEAVTASKPCLTNGDWHHVVATFAGGGSGTVGSVLFYFDGILQPTGYCVNGGGSATILNTLAGPMFFGCNIDIPVARFYDGDLDDVYLYDRALTTAEVTTLFNTQCGISGNQCFCSERNTFSAPLLSGATYSWTGIPGGWSCTGITTNVLSVLGTGTGAVITCDITTSCGGVIVKTYGTPTCNIASGSPAQLSTSGNATLCVNSPNPSVSLSASSTAPGAVFVWMPGDLTGSSITVDTNTPMIYTVTVSSHDFCANTATIAITSVTNCCSTTLTPLASLSGTYNSGPYVITGNITLTGNTNFTGAEFLFAPNVQITIPSGMNLNLDGAHLYACGSNMWQGLVVSNGGSFSSANPSGTGYHGSSLIEDAIVAINLSGIATGFVNPPINIQDVTFNKNRVGIAIVGSSLNNVPISLLGCVFTSRALPFSGLTWPAANTSASGLRFMSLPATSIAPPYLLGGYASANLKAPYNAQTAQFGIKIMTIGQVAGTLPVSGVDGVDIGVTYQGAAGSGSPVDYNLFDNLGAGIDVTDASLLTMNNVFQNMVYNTSLSMTGTGIDHRITTPLMTNDQLDLRPVGTTNQSASFGNRFWNCILGVHTESVYSVKVEYGTYRSTQTTTNITSVFNDGILLESNRFDYGINLNEFENIHQGINMNVFQGLYNMGFGTINGIYDGNISIEQNYFGAEVTSTMSLSNNEYFDRAIFLTGPNLNVYRNIPANKASIISNKVDRAFRGIALIQMFRYPVTISNNNIHLADDNVFVQTQHGITAENNQGTLVITDNLLSGVSLTSSLTNMSLVYCKADASPTVNCNTTSNAYQGFEFEGNNGTASWHVNTMSNHTRGLVLTNSGVIGQQGSTVMNCADLWSGTWGGSLYHTWCNSSSANLSPLYTAITSGYKPTNNGGATIPYSSGSTPPGLIVKTTKPYLCPTVTYPLAPTQRTSEITAIQEAVENSWSLEVYPNPSDGRITLESQLENESIQVRIVDIAGKEVYNKTITTADHSASIELPAAQSIYFMEATNNEHVTLHKKLIIAK